MTDRSRIWIFANNREGYYEDSDWDTSIILKRKRYYFKSSEPNRSKVESGDRVVFREYGSGFWGTCEIEAAWVGDKDAREKHEVDAGWFPITKIRRWDAVLPYEVIKGELSNQNHRLRIAKATDQDLSVIELGLRIYQNLGYGSTDGEFFILESGVEEAIKVNLSQLGLRLADEAIQHSAISESELAAQT